MGRATASVLAVRGFAAAWVCLQASLAAALTPPPPGAPPCAPDPRPTAELVRAVRQPADGQSHAGCLLQSLQSRPHPEVEWAVEALLEGRPSGQAYGMVSGLLPRLGEGAVRFVPRLVQDLDRTDFEFRHEGGVLMLGLAIRSTQAQAAPWLPQIVAFHRRERAELSREDTLFPDSRDDNRLTHGSKLRVGLELIAQVGRYRPEVATAALEEQVPLADPDDWSLLEALMVLAPMAPEGVTRMLLEWQGRGDGQALDVSGRPAGLFFRALAQAGPSAVAAKPMVERWVARCAAMQDAPSCVALPEARAALAAIGAP